MSAVSPQTSAISHSATRRPWRFPTLIAQGQLAFVVLMALGFGVTVAAVIIGIGWKSTISGSVWEPSTNAIPWFVAVMAGHTFFQVVPMLIANGRTRRDATIDALQVSAATVLTVAVLTTVGYLIEWAVYRWQGWPEKITGNHLFTHYDQVGAIFWESLLTFAVWSVLGAMVGAAFYRFDQWGWLSLVPAVIILIGVGIFITSRAPIADNLVERILPDWGRSLPVATLATVIGMGVSGAIIWRIVRDLPLRPWR